MPVTVKVQRLRQSKLPLPAYHSEAAAGLDLLADLDHPITLNPQERAAVPTGIAIQIPQGYEGQVRARSGRALRDGLAVVNAPGTIDSDYRGELNVLLINLGQAPVVIKPAERIAQLIIAPVAHAELIEVETLDGSARGAGGFGHTGN